jgi:hypothetical protein
MQSAQPPRQRLPNRRISTTFVVQCDGISYTVSFSLFSSGALGEIFLSSAKAGCSADNGARDSAPPPAHWRTISDMVAASWRGHHEGQRSRRTRQGDRRPAGTRAAVSRNFSFQAFRHSRRRLRAQSATTSRQVDRRHLRPHGDRVDWSRRA